MRINKILIGIVGPCGSGKSTLAAILLGHGFTCRHIAQEHSYVKDMWKRITNPDILIFLQASYDVCTMRRHLNWSEAEYLEQQNRLSNALQHANLIIMTDNLLPETVAEYVLEYMRRL
jgi:cytidylate kinase